MSSSLQELLAKKSVSVSFERTMDLTAAVTLGVGALMGAGIYVLIGLASGNAGPSVWLSYAVCGLLALPSVFMFGQLSKLMPIAGGGYAYAYQGLGSLAGFLTGWLLALGSIFACAMYAIGFSYYFGSLLGYEVSAWGSRVIALLIVLSLSVLNCRGAKGGDRFQRIFTWGNLIVLLILISSALPQARAERMVPLFPNGLEGTVAAIALIYISFFGYQLIANNAEEVVNPTKTVPRAMLISMLVSLSFYVAVALACVLVVPWEELAASQAPLVEVAARTLGSEGWLLIAVGGVLASAAALNSTLLSQGRQIYAMGKHGFLPSLLGQIHELRKTPNAALIAGGGLTAAAAIFGDLEFVAKSANFCFITSLLSVSLALRQVMRTSGEAPPFWKRFLPEIALVSNLALLITLDWLSFVFGLHLLGAGMAVYFFYSRSRETRSRFGMSVILTERPEPFLRRGTRILTPMANPATQHAIFSISESLLVQGGGEIVVLSVVNAPEQVDFHSALGDSENAIDVLETSTKLKRSMQVKLRPVVRVSRDLARGIVDAAEEQGCNLIVMGYPGAKAGGARGLVEDLLNYTQTDLVLLRLKDEFRPRRVAVALAGMINLDLMVRLAGAVADQHEAVITFLNVLPTEYTAEHRTHADKVLSEAIRRHRGSALYRTEVLRSDHPVDLIVERSREFDLLIVGSSKVGIFEKVVVGAFAVQVVERSQCSVAVVRAIPPHKKAWTRIVGKP
jgi:amino acid transporter/nucleotide-binding universal stress UspA family protein